MFTLKPIAVCVSMLTIAPAALAQAPQLGQPIAPADIAAWDIASDQMAQVCRLVVALQRRVKPYM
jgi:hypothetical protein